MQIKIGPIHYDVVEYAFDGETRCGDIDSLKCRIRINESMPPCNKRVTLWHEIVHGILYAAGQTKDHDEIVIDAIAHGLTQVLTDNPELR